MSKLYDVAIIGAGPSGIAAAIYAAKNGVNTVLIEKDSIIGGSAIKAQAHTLRMASNDTMDNLLNGITKRAWNRTIFHPEELVDRYYYQLQRYSVDIFCDHSVISIETNERDITSILCLSPDGKKGISAKVFIDASSSCVMEKLTGNKKEEGQQRCYITALVGKVETIGGRCYSDEAQKLLQDSVKHAKHSQRMDNDIEIEVSPTVRGDIALLEVGANVHGEDMGSVMREHLTSALQFLQEFGFGFENVSIISSAKNVFYNTSGASKSCYRLTYDDVVSGKRFEDSIASLRYDNRDMDESLDNVFNIPYRTQLSTEFSNLLYCGRTIGINPNAKAMIDGTPIHFETGKAAGIAAALAVKNNIALSQVSLEDIRSEIGFVEIIQDEVQEEASAEIVEDNNETDIKKAQQIESDRLCNFMPINEQQEEEIMNEDDPIEKEDEEVISNKYLSFTELDVALGLLDGSIVQEEGVSLLQDNMHSEESIDIEKVEEMVLGDDGRLVDEKNLNETDTNMPKPLYDSIFSCYDKFDEIDEKSHNTKEIEKSLIDKRPKHLKDGEESLKIDMEEYNADNKQTIRPEKKSAQKTDDAIDKLKRSAKSTIYDDIFGLDFKYSE